MEIPSETKLQPDIKSCRQSDQRHGQKVYSGDCLASKRNYIRDEYDFIYNNNCDIVMSSIN